MGILDRVESAIDKVKDSATNAILKVCEPKVHTEITQHVKEFEDKTLRELPHNAEKHIYSMKNENTAAWACTKAFGDDTSVIIERIVRHMRPGISEATTGLSERATQLVMDRVRDGLDADGDSEDEAEEKSMAANAQEIEGQRSSRRARRLNRKLPGIEGQVREQAHPLFQSLEAEVQRIAPAALRDSLREELLGKQREAGGAREDAEHHHPNDRGILDKLKGSADSIGDWLKSTTTPALEKGIDLLVGAVDGPLATTITRLVAELEESSMASAFAALRQQLGKYHLADKV